MKTSFPLYARILLWFFLNLVLLGMGFIFLFNAQFQFNLDWFIAGIARPRIESVRNLIIGELNTRPFVEWDEIFQKYDEAYHVRFLLYGYDGKQIAGERIDLPDEVAQRVRGYRRYRDDGSHSTEVPSSQRDNEIRSEESRVENRGNPRPPPRFLLRTSDPTRYWVLNGTRLESREPFTPRRATLIIMSENLSGGGLFIDFKPWITMGSVALIFSLLFWIPLVRGITRSIAQMTRATEQMAEGQFDIRVSAQRKDELGALGHSINQMAQRLDGFVKGQKRFLGDIAHELCSPLARLQMALGILEQKADPQQKKHLEVSLEKAKQISSLVNELLLFSKASMGEKNLKMETSLVHDLVQIAVDREKTTDVTLEVDVPRELEIRADTDLFVRALSNLIRNAIHYAGKEGPIQIRAAKESDKVIVSVLDNGPGIPEDDLPKIFDPFYRVDPSRDRNTGGVGLGLTIVKTCVESMGGTIHAANRREKGLEIRMSFPIPVS